MSTTVSHNTLVCLRHAERCAPGFMGAIGDALHLELVIDASSTEVRLKVPDTWGKTVDDEHAKAGGAHPASLVQPRGNTGGSWAGLKNHLHERTQVRVESFKRIHESGSAQASRRCLSRHGFPCPRFRYWMSKYETVFVR